MYDIHIAGTENPSTVHSTIPFRTYDDDSEPYLNFDPNNPWSHVQFQPMIRNRVMDKEFRQKPGPKPSSVRLKLYLLPLGSKLPSLTKKDPIIQIHQDQGYGMYDM